ncbi:MAG: glycoside hydrolase family 16 protein, partial [Rubrobacter sp.]|nr:glycoside hydrolase family 16 protein [Rubrobacter sp.]
LPARPLDGGEVYTDGLYGHGSYTARMKVPRAPGSITGFFTYKSPDYASELDIEIFNDSSRKIVFTTYSGGNQTHPENLKLPIDPTAGYHEYRFDYHEDYVSFYADGQLMRRWYSGHPDTTMHLMINAWHPTWLQGKKPPRDQYLLVDYVDYQQDLESASSTDDLTATGGDQLLASESAPPKKEAKDNESGKGGKKKR